MSDENTQNLDKYAEELSDYLNKANTNPQVIQETPGCGKAMVYSDRFDSVDVDPKKLNIEGYFVDKSLNSLFTQKMKEWFPSDVVNDETIKELFQKTNIDMVEFIKNIIKKMSERKENIKTVTGHNENDKENTNINILERIILKILFGLSRESPGVNIHYNNSIIKDKDSPDYLQIFKFQDNTSGMDDYRHQVYVYSKYLIMLEKIKKQLENNGTDKDEINLQLLYVLLFCLNTGEDTIRVFSKFGHALMEMTNKPIIMNRKFDINDYIKDKNELVKINNSFKEFYLPKNIYPLNSKLLPIQQLNKNDFDIYVSFDKNELIMTTYQLLYFTYGPNMMLGLVIDKIDTNITKKTYSNYFQYCWTTNFNMETMKNTNNSSFINSLFDTLDKLEQNPTTGGKRRARKTVKRKKNTPKKRKRCKSIKIMRRQRLRPRNRTYHSRASP
uniref:Uncharacterized protein n=1 Tax=viral metagenome TaxID=1070528 RepID=A0A6C0HAD6_9ZZZZ